MHPQMKEIRCSIMRGGTSKGIFIRENDLPKDLKKRNRIIRSIFGSPDIRQIDGLGGADVLTSKLAIVGPASVPDADVDYTFGQVSFLDDTIDYSGNCGNISSAVGPYAIDAGIIQYVEPVTTVRIHLTNSNRIIKAEVPVCDGRASVEGDCRIDGVPGTGAPVVMDWSGITGAFTGKLLPTGNAKDKVKTKSGVYTVSLVDAGNPLVFIKAEDLGMNGIETPAEIESNDCLMKTIEEIRCQAAKLFGLVDKAEDATKDSPYNPFFAIVSKPASYDSIQGEMIDSGDVDIVSRLLFMLHMHKAYPVTGTVCTGAAARVKDSVVWDLLSDEAKERTTLRIGHPSGVIEVEAEADINGKDHIDSKEDSVKFKRLGVLRTARKIMDGYVYVKNSVFSEGE